MNRALFCYILYKEYTISFGKTMSIKPQDRINGSSKASLEKPFEMKQDSPTALTLGACPFIGLEDDPGTRLLFVSPAACCHRADPVSAVNLTQQQDYCLITTHKLCPVFVRPEWSPLPPELQYYESVTPFSNRRWFWGVVGLVVLSLIVGMLFVWDGGNFTMTTEAEPEENLPVVVMNSTSTPTSTPASAATATQLPTKTAVAMMIPTDTPVPTQTAEPPTVIPTATLVPTFTPMMPTETAVPPVLAAVNVARLNIRSGPGTTYDLLGTVDEGEQIELTGRLSDSSWWQICCVLGESGWVISEAIEIPAEAEIVIPVIAGLSLPPTEQP